MKKISERMAVVKNDELTIDLTRSYIRCFYLEKELLEVHILGNQIYITELANAQKTGKICKTYCYDVARYENNSKVFLCEVSNAHGRTIGDLVKVLRGGLMDNVTVYEREKRGVDTFSPFISQKPIKTPKEWRKAHIIKAIYSGQITSCVGAGTYTDDYAYDAAVNFGIGTNHNLLELAKDLIESHLKGYYFREDKKNGFSEICIANYSFDYKTVVFNEKTA